MDDLSRAMILGVMARKRMSARRKKSPSRWKLKLGFNLILLAGLVVWYALQPATRREEVNRLVQNYFEKNKRVELTDLARDIYQLYYGRDVVAVTLPEGDSAFVLGGWPEAKDGSRLKVLLNQGYCVGYDEDAAEPRWAAYRMQDITPIPEPAKRPEKFDTDRRTIARVESDAYTGSGYDRGHLAPNYAIATRYGDEAQRETFLMSNIIPQTHGLNAGLWKQLEMKIATSYPARMGEVWVLAGPVLEPDAKRLGSHGPKVPAGCYMIIFDEREGGLRSESFVFPQTATGELNQYLVSIDDIEKRTGLDFLSGLPDDAENRLEEIRATAVW